MSDPALVALRESLSSVIVGQQNLLDRLIVALIAGGHVLLEGPPGVAKTTAVQALAGAVDANFQRIQFTPDLLPGDLTGSEVYSQASGEFRFIPGPLFHEILLADEINRAPPKVQSALLEAMAEQQITVAGQTRPLPALFMVLATQNPLEQSGTHPLPEAQLDRFLFHVRVDYPNAEEELEISRRARKAPNGHIEQGIKASLTPQVILAWRKQAQQVFIEESVEKYAINLIMATRELGKWLPEHASDVLSGASPRGSIDLLRSAAVMAMLDQRDYVLPQDVSALASDVLRHRIVMDFSAREDFTADRLIEAVLKYVPAP